MTAQVSLVLAEAKQALCIPTTALGEREKDGRHSVRVLVNNQPVTVRVRSGINNNLQVQILEGLRDGDRVIIGDSSTLPAVTASAQPGPPPGGRR